MSAPTNTVDTRPRGNVKSATAFRTISEVSIELNVPQHVLRFWETKFSQIRPLKRGGGRRYYRPEDVDLLRRIQQLLYKEGYTIKGVQRLLREGRIDLPTGPEAEDEEPEDDSIDDIGAVNAIGPMATGNALVAVTSAAALPVSLGLSDDQRDALSDVVSELIHLRTLLRGCLD